MLRLLVLAASGERYSSEPWNQPDCLHRKSQLAIEYTYQERDAVPDKWAFWVHAGTRARFEEGYRRIDEATKMEGWDGLNMDVLRLVRSWLSNESNGRWIMVVNNADDSDIFIPKQSSKAVETENAGQERQNPDPNVSHSPQVAEPLSEFLPLSSMGSILMTSRNRDVAYKLTGSFESVLWKSSQWMIMMPLLS